MANPFFSGNYGSSPGDFSQAANLIAQAGQIEGQARARAGQQMGQMFANLGKIAGDSIAKFDEKKKKKREEKQNASMIGGLLKQNPELAKNLGIAPTDEMTFEEAVDESSLAIARNSKGMEFVKNLMQMDQQLALAKQQKQLFEIGMEERRRKEALAKYMMTPGPKVIDPKGPDRNSVLRNLRAGKGVTPPARMIQKPSPAEATLITPQAKEFIRSAMKAGQPMGEVLPMAQRIDANVVSQTPSPPSPSDQLAREKFEYEKMKDRRAELPSAPPDTKYVDATLSAINDAISLSDSFFATGLSGQLLSNLAGTEATDLRSAIDTITSGVGFTRLQEMREASKTGGALGNVSERELAQLNASLGSINPNQSPEQLKKNLSKIKQVYERTLRVLNAEKIAYENNLTFKTIEDAEAFISKQNNTSRFPMYDPQEIDRVFKEKQDLARKRGL